MLYNVYCARALAMLERKWWEGKLSLCHDWMHWWCDKSTANKEVVMIGWCTSWCKKKLAGGKNVTIVLTGPPSRNILRFLFHPLFRYLIYIVEILLLQNVQNFFPKMHSEWLSFGIELLFVSGQSFKETQTVFSYRICQQSIQPRSVLSAILKNKISGSTRWEENQTCLNLLPPLSTK